MPSMPSRDTSIIDELILDYLLHNCISALFLEWDVRHAEGLEGEGYPPGNTRALVEAEAAAKADRSLLLVNSFLQTYQQLHPSGVRSLHRDVRFRIILCRFVSLLLRRIDPASSFARKPQTTVLRFRNQRNIRLQRYLKCRGDTHIFPDTDLHDQFLLGEHELLPACLLRYCIQRFGSDDDDSNEEEGNDQDGHQGVTSHITRISTISAHSICGTASLSDSLPLFMLLSAWTSTAVLGSPVSTLWMNIAASFMVHAFAEDYLCHGVPPLQALSENFAWGVVPLDGDEKEEMVDMEDIIVNEMFGADEGEVSKSWEEIRKKVLKEIVPPTGIGLESHLVHKVLAKENGVDEGNHGSNESEKAWLVGSFPSFERNLVEGLAMAMVRTVGKPVLTQLEQGQLDGVEDVDVEELLSRAGVVRET